MGVSAPTTGTLIRRLENELGIFVDMTPDASRGKRYALKEYLES